jgi:hypothetical protein
MQVVLWEPLVWSLLLILLLIFWKSKPQASCEYFYPITMHDRVDSLFELDASTRSGIFGFAMQSGKELLIFYKPRRLRGQLIVEFFLYIFEITQVKLYPDGPRIVCKFIYFIPWEPGEKLAQYTIALKAHSAPSL